MAVSQRRRTVKRVLSRHHNNNKNNNNRTKSNWAILVRILKNIQPNKAKLVLTEMIKITIVLKIRMIKVTKTSSHV
jgi:hypothetical protein